MSKRRGDVVFLDEFMDEIGVDAARWYLVNRSPDQSIEIDVDLAAERSEKNPVYYVQYAHARIAGILRNAGDAEAVGRAGRSRSRRRSATWSSASPSFPRSSRRRPSAAGRTGSRPTRSGSPTTSIASTTTTACSRATSRRSGSRSAARRSGDRDVPRPRRGGGAGADVARQRALFVPRSSTARAPRHRIAAWREPPDRNLALELVRVTEAAAMAAGRWVGRGDKIAADQAAVDAMRADARHRLDAGRRRDRRGREGRGADALQRRGGRERPTAPTSTSPSTRSRARG